MAKIISDLLIVFKVVVEKFNLTGMIFNTFPNLPISPESLTLILTVLVGLGILYLSFFILTTLCRFTLSFFIFIKLALMAVIAIGVFWSISGFFVV